MKFFINLIFLLAFFSTAHALDNDDNNGNASFQKNGIISICYSDMQLTDEDWQEVVSNPENLEMLELRNIRLPFFATFGKAFPSIAHMHFPALKELRLTGNYGWNDGDNSILTFISYQTNLETLSLKNWWFGDKLGRYRDYIVLSDMGVLSTLSKLKRLDLENTRFLPENIEQLQYIQLPALEELNIFDSMGLKGVHWDAFAPNLKVLNLIGGDTNGKDLVHIANLQQLVELDVSGSKVTGGSVKQLAKLPYLKELALGLTDMKNADFSDLQSLERLHLYGVNFSIASFNSLQRLHNLKELDLREIHSYGKNPNISDAMIQKLQSELPNCDIEL